MSATVTFHGMDELHSFLDGLPDGMFKAAKKAVSNAVFNTQKKVTSNLAIQPRTGSLFRSMTPEVTGTDLASLNGRLYSTVLYARIQEYGGVVKAKNKYLGVPGGPYLNIPTAANKTAAGVMKMNAQTVFAQGGHVQKTKAGNYGVFLAGQMMFLLRRQVTLKPRLGLADAAAEQVVPMMAELETLVQAALEEKPI